jgi:hypothetical protein
MLNHFTDAHGEKSGKHKFAFAWNLLGGGPTQGHRQSRKKITFHTKTRNVHQNAGHLHAFSIWPSLALSRIQADKNTASYP